MMILVVVLVDGVKNIGNMRVENKDGKTIIILNEEGVDQYQEILREAEKIKINAFFLKNNIEDAEAEIISSTIAKK